MDVLNFLAELPFELLEIVLDHLRSEDLKNLLAVDPRVRDVIIASPISMRKLKLQMNETWMEKVGFIKEFGDCVKVLHFDYCKFELPDEFRDLLKIMRSIEKLRLSNVHLSAEVFNKKFKILLLKFSMLKELSLDNSQAVGKLVRLYLRKVQVKKLKLDFCHYNVVSEMKELLWNQKRLTTLELAGFDNVLFLSLFKHDISYTLEFELKRLILNHRVTRNELFLRFIKALTSLESLEVHKEIEIQDFFNVVFALPNLRSLTLKTNFVTLKNIDFKKASNSKIQELVLVTRNQYGIEQTINYLVMKLVELKTLKVVNLKTDSSDQMLGFVHLKGLQKLHIENSKLKFMQNIKLDNLRSLHLHNLHPFLKFEDWDNFFKTNTKIEEIVISEFEVYCVVEAIKAEISKIIDNLGPILKTIKHLEIHQEMRYQKPMKLIIDIDQKLMKVSDSFIKICRDHFHFLRKLTDFHLTYYADDCLELNNKYLK